MITKKGWPFNSLCGVLKLPGRRSQQEVVRDYINPVQSGRSGNDITYGSTALAVDLASLKR